MGGYYSGSCSLVIKKLVNSLLKSKKYYLDSDLKSIKKIFSSYGIVLIILMIFSKSTALSKITLLVHYLGLFALFHLTVFWLEKKTKIPVKVLGLTKGRYSFKNCIFIGFTTSFLYSIVYFSTAFWKPNYLHELFFSKHLFSILAPLSIRGFGIIILAPISEEVFFRGFLYGYLLKKISMIIRLLVQSIIFASLHLNFTIFGFLNYLLLGLLFGILYEKTRSLHTSIICHGFINYFITIFSLT